MAVTRDDLGNVQVDFVWGNFPLQPDADRGEDTLDPGLDNHIIATTGYANFPQFLPNYAGDGDTGFETIVPNVRGLFLNAAQDAIEAAYLGYDITWITPLINSISTSGKTATITLDDQYSYNLAVGDIISGYYNDGDAISGTFIDGKVKAVDGDAITVTLKTAISPALNISSAVNSNLFVNYTGGTDNRYVLSQDQEPGVTVNRGVTVGINVLVNND